MRGKNKTNQNNRGNNSRRGSNKKKAKDRKLLFSLLVIFSVVIFFSAAYNNLRADVKVNGSENIVEVNTNYEDKGATATYKGKKISQDKIKVSGQVDAEKLGKYKIEYSIKHNGILSKAKKKVEVRDTKPPVITLEGETSCNLCPKDEFAEPGYSCLDNYDKDLTKAVEVEVKYDKVIYKVKDSSGNKAQMIRTLNRKDKEAPEITLNGSETYYISLNSQYADPGYEVSDNFDKDLKDKVKVTGEVDSSKLGEYKLKYEVADCSGNKAGAERTVIVTDKPLPSGQNSTIYLTFDDGNSSKTPKILDILKKEKIKATFFVVGTNLNPEIMKRIVDEGHAIGLHTDTHKHEQLYASPEAYFHDLESLRKKVKDMTGVDSKIIRFPGGSSNSISKRYSPGIMTYLVNEVHVRGYHYFDWNVGSSDTGNIGSDQIYQNVTNGLGIKETYVVLFHDIEKNQPTVDALTKIIQYGKSHGYKFDKITMSTPEIHHGVTN